MKKLLLVPLLALSLGGCATQFGQKLETIYSTLTSPISPRSIVVVANAFDAAEATAAQYLNYCHGFKPSYPPECALATRQKVVAGVKSARSFRDQMEPYITSGTTAPAELYDALNAAITSLQSSIPVAGVAK